MVTTEGGIGFAVAVSPLNRLYILPKALLKEIIEYQKRILNHFSTFSRLSLTLFLSFSLLSVLTLLLTLLHLPNSN